MIIEGSVKRLEGIKLSEICQDFTQKVLISHKILFMGRDLAYECLYKLNNELYPLNIQCIEYKISM